MPECALLVGLPGAGKTTFFRRHLGATHVHVSKDLMPHARRREARQAQLIVDALASGRSVAVDNTNPTISDRATIIALARAHRAQVVGYFVESTTRESIARSAGRQGRERVPNVAIFTAAKRLQPPHLAEGFDRLYRVRVREDGEFDVAVVESD